MVTIIRREVRKRGFVGKLFKWTFVGFNLLMVVWLASYLADTVPETERMIDGAGKSGARIGILLGSFTLMVVWAAGALILGLFTLFTRGPLTIIEERADEVGTRREPSF